MTQENPPKTSLTVLCLEDSLRDTELISDMLRESGYDLRMDRADTLAGFAALLRTKAYDVILSDFKLPGFDAFSALEVSREVRPDIPFICVSGTIGEETAIEVIKRGAVDYVIKDHMARLPIAIQRARDEVRERLSRRNVEETLSQSEERFRALFTYSPDALYVHVDGTVTLVNPAFCQLLGAGDPSHLIGKSVFEIVHPEYHDIVRDRLRRVFAGEPAPLIQEQFVRLDGSRVDVEVCAVLIEWQGARGVQVIARDITGRKRAQEALQESERRFRELFDDAPVGYHELDVEGRIVEVNRTELEMLGYSPEEMLRHGAWEFIVEEQTSRKAIAAKIAGSMPLGGMHERTFRRKNGTTLNVLVTDRALLDEGGKTVGIRSTLQDITGRKKAEQELRLMAQTVASAQDCICITDLENRLLFVNEAFRETYGFSEEELLGRDVAIVRTPQPAGLTDRMFHDTLRGGWHGEIMNRRKDGTDFPVELWTSIVKDEDGHPVAMVGVARDIATRKKAEDHLRHSEEQFRLIAENVADMIAVVGLDGRRIYNSPSYRNTLGDPDALRGTDAFREIHPDDRAKVKAVFDETVRTGVGQRMEYRLVGKDNAERNIESRGSVIRDQEGKVSRIIVVSRDVTEEKRLEAQFLRAQRLESIGTLAGGIAHDLNNVLAPIVMAIEVLRSRIPDAAGQKILNTLETSAKRGSDIVRQVLAFGRGVKGDRILVQLKHVVSEVVKIIVETFPKSITIQLEAPRGLWTVSADPTQMHQVFLNMLVNARDAMPRGGLLTISAKNVHLDEQYSRMHVEASPGAYVCIAIGDTGMGIPAEIREKVFEPFFTTKEIGVGTGLGLSTTLAIVKSHGGFIDLDSEVGKGTTFSIYIPATESTSGAGMEDEKADLPKGHGELILVIDDESAIREITVETLEAYGYRAIAARDGAEGVALYAENRKAVMAVITDIMMPIMDGTATILALKRINPQVKIIAASGLTSRGDDTPPADPSIQAFLTKPYTAETLLTTLAAALR